VLYLPGESGQALLDEPRAVMAAIDINPPLAALGKTRGWQPLPLTVKQARRFLPRDQRSLAMERSAAAESATLATGNGEKAGAPLAVIDRVAFSYDGHEALRNVSLALRPGEVVALMGRNGSGKSTLLKLLAGLVKPSSGRVSLSTGGQQLDTRSAALDDIVRVVGYVPQNPGALLFKDTVLEELAFTRQGHTLPPDPVADRALLARLGLAEQAERYPRDLSTGQRQRVALAAILAAEPLVLLLDEPTRGLDYAQKEALTAILLDLRRQGRAVLLATHDVELVARSADRVVLLGEGQVVVVGPTRQVMTGSLVFASQINKLYRDPRYLIVEDAVTN
jgi:energy-coupling factor transport system ATP-binding protein